MSGVMNAYHQKDATAYQQAYQQWKLSHDALEKSAAIESAGYEKAKEMELRGDIAGANAMLRAHAAANRNQPILDSLDRGDYHTASHIASGTVRAAGNLAPVGKTVSTQTDYLLAYQKANDEMAAAELTGDSGKIEEARTKADNATMGAWEWLKGHGAQLKQQKFTMLENDAKRIEASRKTTDEAKNVGVPQTIQITDPDGKTRDVLASYNKKTGEWIDTATRKAVDFKGGTVRQVGKMSAEEAALGPKIPQTQEQKDSIAAQTATGEPLIQIVPGYGKQAVKARENAREDAIELLRKQNPGMSAKEAGVELASRALDWGGAKRSVPQLTTMLDTTKVAVGQLDFNIRKAQEEIAKLHLSDLSPFISRIQARVEKWDGTPEYSSAYFYMHAAAQESARILSGGTASIAQLQQGASEEAKKWAELGMTPASFDQAAIAMTAEGQNRIQELQDTLTSRRNNPSAVTGTSGGAGAARPAAGPVPKPASFSDAQLLEKAGDAIKAGKPRQAIIDQLRAWGIDPKGL
jgi:hypothetical protein